MGKSRKRIVIIESSGSQDDSLKDVKTYQSGGDIYVSRTKSGKSALSRKKPRGFGFDLLGEALGFSSRKGVGKTNAKDNTSDMELKRSKLPSKQTSRTHKQAQKSKAPLGDDFIIYTARLPSIKGKSSVRKHSRRRSCCQQARSSSRKLGYAKTLTGSSNSETESESDSHSEDDDDLVVVRDRLVPKRRALATVPVNQGPTPPLPSPYSYDSSFFPFTCPYHASFPDPYGTATCTKGFAGFCAVHLARVPQQQAMGHIPPPPHPPHPPHAPVTYHDLIGAQATSPGFVPHTYGSYPCNPLPQQLGSFPPPPPPAPQASTFTGLGDQHGKAGRHQDNFARPAGSEEARKHFRSKVALGEGQCATQDKRTAKAAPDENSKLYRHVCAGCGKERSEGYQILHRLKEGEKPKPAVCKRCERRVEFTDAEKSANEQRTGSVHNSDEGNELSVNSSEEEEQTRHAGAHRSFSLSTAELSGSRASTQYKAPRLRRPAAKSQKTRSANVNAPMAEHKKTSRKEASKIVLEESSSGIDQRVPRSRDEPPRPVDKQSSTEGFYESRSGPWPSPPDGRSEREYHREQFADDRSKSPYFEKKNGPSAWNAWRDVNFEFPNPTADALFGFADRVHVFEDTSWKREYNKNDAIFDDIAAAVEHMAEEDLLRAGRKSGLFNSSRTSGSSPRFKEPMFRAPSTISIETFESEAGPVDAAERTFEKATPLKSNMAATKRNVRTDTRDEVDEGQMYDYTNNKCRELVRSSSDESSISLQQSVRAHCGHSD